MVKRTSNEKKTANGKASTVSKGRVLERIAALMHAQSGVTVKNNQFLSPLSGKGRKREIDILLTGTLAGYPVRMAIECKNEKTSIGAPKIDAFIGKLSYLGIPPQYGIYISASGYTTAAIEEAMSVGMKVLTLQGLTDEALFGSIASAFQSIIYLLLQVTRLEICNQMPPNNFEAFGFYNEDGRLSALLPDFVWQKWLDNKIPTSLGEHEVDLPLPSGLNQMANGKIFAVLKLGAKVRVLGLVVTLEGKAKEYRLVNAENEAVERSLVDVTFDAPNSELPVTTVQSEEELQAFLRRPGAIQLTVGRTKLPRIQNGAVYWPPSERVAQELQKRWHSFEAGDISDPRLINLQELEGTDLRTIWEPIWEGHPAGAKKADRYGSGHEKN